MLKVIVLTLSTITAISLGLRTQRQEYPSQIIRIHAKGGSPFDSDILLPYSMIQQIYQLAHNSKLVHTKVRAIIAPRSKWKRTAATQFPYWKSPHFNRQSRTFLSAAKPAKGEMHFERDHAQVRNFKLYDDDGEHLLNLNDLSKPPTIANITTAFKTLPEAINQSGIGGTRKSKKLVKHVWINL